ncbi:MAG: APC family permease [Deltaproteobacteria bacterium]|nr:MAG: APC family permease [Deltaproteobacteria bacterium]
MEPGPPPVPSEPPPFGPVPPPSRTQRLKRLILGGPKDLQDPQLFRHISLVAFLAWVGLGADGLSSSAYGPQEAFKNLGEHTYLAVLLAAATAFTVIIIAAAYSRVIEHFPFGGGGYVVASRLLGPRLGVVSGCALLVDYVLTISVSIAAGGDAVFSVLPDGDRWARLIVLGLPLKLQVELAAFLLLVVLNLRGVKESVTVLMPIFLAFLVTHAVVIVVGIGLHLGRMGEVAHDVSAGFTRGVSTLGWGGLALLFLRAYSLGGGTYTGIEAVSNGLQIMREPRVQTGKRTMAYMAVSLAITASGIILCYLLLDVRYVDDNHTMNSLLAMRVLGSWPMGKALVFITLMSEALLLFVAAQAGFIDVPRVMANMAHDSWFPHRFSALSDRFTMQNGVLLIGGAGFFMLLYTRGAVDALVVMYSINVFLTFSLTQAGMTRYWFTTRKQHSDWKSHIWIHLVGGALCVTILVITVAEKFGEGGWLTAVATGALIALCMAIKRHYEGVFERLRRLDAILDALPRGPAPPLPIDKKKPTAVLLVSGYSGLGIHSLLTILKLFPRVFHNVLFMTVGVVDSATFQGVEEVERVRAKAEEDLRKYVDNARRMGLPADYRLEIGTEAVSTCVKLSEEIAKEFERPIFFSGKLIFEQERWWDRFLHNETAMAIQRRLQFAGLAMVVLPVRVLG